MLKEILKEKKLSIYQAARQAQIPCNTLNDLVNKKVAIENCKCSTLYNIANVLNISMDELYDKCRNNNIIYEPKHNIYATINIKNKHYFLNFIYKDDKIEILLNKVNALSTHYIQEIAKWELDAFLSKKEMEELYEIYINEKK